MRVAVTGATGFVGRALLARLTEAGHQVRLLLRPSPGSPRLPRGIPFEVALASPYDPRGAVAGLVGANVVYHLAGAEAVGARADLERTEALATRTIVEAAREAGVGRLMFLSHLGAERASAYPLLRAKAAAEEAVRQGGVDHTIVRCAALYGPGDRLTEPLAMTLATAPGVYLLPGDGASAVQPLHIDDLATALLWWLDQDGLIGQTYEIGGPEWFPWREVVNLVMKASRQPRRLVGIAPPALRWILRLGEAVLPAPPFTVLLLDYLASGRTAPLDALPRVFGLEPRRMEASLDHLAGRRWSTEWLRRQWARGGDNHA